MHAHTIHSTTPLIACIYVWIIPRYVFQYSTPLFRTSVQRRLRITDTYNATCAENKHRSLMTP